MVQKILHGSEVTIWFRLLHGSDVTIWFRGYYMVHLVLPSAFCEGLVLQSEEATVTVYEVQLALRRTPRLPDLQSSPVTQTQTTLYIPADCHSTRYFLR